MSQYSCIQKWIRSVFRTLTLRSWLVHVESLMTQISVRRQISIGPGAEEIHLWCCMFRISLGRDMFALTRSHQFTYMSLAPVPAALQVWWRQTTQHCACM